MNRRKLFNPWTVWNAERLGRRDGRKGTPQADNPEFGWQSKVERAVNMALQIILQRYVAKRRMIEGRLTRAKAKHQKESTKLAAIQERFDGEPAHQTVSPLIGWTMLIIAFFMEVALNRTAFEAIESSRSTSWMIGIGIGALFFLLALLVAHHLRYPKRTKLENVYIISGLVVGIVGSILIGTMRERSANNGQGAGWVMIAFQIVIFLMMIAGELLLIDHLAKAKSKEANARGTINALSGKAAQLFQTSKSKCDELCEYGNLLATSYWNENMATRTTGRFTRPPIEFTVPERFSKDTDEEWQKGLGLGNQVTA